MFDAEKKAGQKIVKYAMKIAFKVIYLAFLLNAVVPLGTKQGRTLLAGDYRCQKIAYVSIPEEMVIAPGRNDGINRLYVAGSKPSEITWNGSGWDTLAMGETTSARSIVAGFGRNDSVCRIYIGDGMGARLWEYSYDGGIWNRTMIDDRSMASLWAVALGDIKNDDTIRVVAGGDDSTLIAYTYQAGLGTWRKDSLPSVRRYICDIDIGPGRNDDTNRIYAVGDWGLVEYSFRNNFWDTTYNNIHAYCIRLASVKNDSIVRLYVSSSGIFEYQWDNMWTLDSLPWDGYAHGPVYDVYGRNDSIMRLYVATARNELIDSFYAKIYIYEYFNNLFGEWQRYFLDTIIWNPEGYPRFTMLSVVAGDARNDGLNRIYGSCGNHEIFEWEWDDTLSSVVGEPRDEKPHVYITGIAVRPNPFRGKAVITYNLSQSGHVSLDIYDISGRLVTGNSIGKKQAGTHLFVWGGKNHQGRSMPPGVYFVSLCVDGRRAATGKLVKIN